MANLISVSLLAHLIFASWPPVSGKLLVTPKDVVVALGEKVQLNCSTDDSYGVNWSHVPFGSTTIEDVFISRVVVLPYHPTFKVERNEADDPIQDYNLVITSVRREDAGKYTCIDRVGHGEQRDAQLVVLNSGPQCNSNIDEEGFVGDNDCEMSPGEISCSCSLQYFGNDTPVMEWTNSAGQVIEPQPPVDTTQANNVSSDLVVKPRLTMSGTSIVWRPKLLKSNNWTSPDVKVKYAMKNGREVNVTRGESVVCSANSSETCTYKWTTQNGTTVGEAALLTIVNTGVYFCDATCSLRHNKCAFRSMEAEFKEINEDNMPTEESSNKTALTVTVAGAVIVVVLMSSIVVFLTLRRTRAKTGKMKRDIPHVADRELHPLHRPRPNDEESDGCRLDNT